MTYRLATPNDIEAIRELCKNEGLDFPTLQICMVADDNGKIVGYVNAMVIPIIDTVCGNPIASKSLQDKFSGYLLGIGYQSELMFTKKPDVESVAVKYGYKKIKDGMNIYTKEI